jgi:hypothetical protein
MNPAATAATTSTVAGLNIFTIGIVLVIAIAALFWFLRKPGNRKPMAGKQETNVAERIDRGQPAPRHNPPK